MTDKVNELLVKWAERKWPEHKGEFDTVRVNSTSWTEGYCETCFYEVTGVDVYLRKGGTYVATYNNLEYDLASMLNDVLGDS